MFHSKNFYREVRFRLREGKFFRVRTAPCRLDLGKESQFFWTVEYLFPTFNFVVSGHSRMREEVRFRLREGVLLIVPNFFLIRTARYRHFSIEKKQCLMFHSKNFYREVRFRLREGKFFRVRTAPCRLDLGKESQFFGPLSTSSLLLIS